MSFTQSSQSKAKTLRRASSSDFREEHVDVVMCFGTFDLFHPGHRYYLDEAMKYGEKHIIVIARDARVTSLKRQAPIDSEAVRLQNVKVGYPIAEVILGDQTDIFAPIRKYKPDLLIFGYDQRVPTEALETLFPNIKYLRIPAFEPEKWKSSKLRNEKRL